MFLQEIGSAAILAREEDLCKSVSRCKFSLVVAIHLLSCFHDCVFLDLAIGHIFKECTVQKGNALKSSLMSFSDLSEFFSVKNSFGSCK